MHFETSGWQELNHTIGLDFQQLHKPNSVYPYSCPRVWQVVYRHCFTICHPNTRYKKNMALISCSLHLWHSQIYRHGTTYRITSHISFIQCQINDLLKNIIRNTVLHSRWFWGFIFQIIHTPVCSRVPAPPQFIILNHFSLYEKCLVELIHLWKDKLDFSPTKPSQKHY